MTMTADIPVRSRTTTKQKVGLVLCFLNSLASVPSFLQGDPAPGEEGPPEAVLILASVLGLVGLIATVLAWRGSGLALRIAAGTIIVNTLTSLPAFFVDVSTGIKMLAAFGVVLCVVTIVLMFSGNRRTAPVTD
jgi:lysylphosphatidylglycerol synthetase-like protein (DUF2156 family)